MLRRLPFKGFVSLSLAGMVAPAQAQAPATVPTTTRVVSTAPAPSSVERARQGVVVLERQGKPLALGAVLDGDGRVLTALSPLTHGNFLTARYHDGAVVPVKLVHSDRAWDLALVMPQSSPPAAPRTLGVRAAKAPSFAGLQGFKLAPPSAVASQPAELKLVPALQGGDGASLTGAYELSTKPALVGGPIVTPEGEVVALVARACPAGGPAACVPSPYGAPVAALKQFLQRAPAEAAWLGIEGVTDESRGVRTVRVLAITPDSPAAAAGLRPGKDATQADLIVAVDGKPVGTPAELNEAVRARASTDSIELLLFGMGRYRRVAVRPRPAPQLVKTPYVVPPAEPAKRPTPNPDR